MQTTEIAKVREFSDRFRDSLPSSVDVAALGVRSKAPFQLLCAREALIWRTEELARNVCDALERDDFAVAAILTRAIVENAALTWKLMELLEARRKYSVQELNDLLMRALVGSKSWGDMPKPFHVLDCIDRMDKKIPGVKASYDSLSEIAHPNWRGVLGLYSKTDEKNFITYFGRGLRGTKCMGEQVINSALASLGSFEYAYNHISNTMPEFVAELESIWSDDK